MQRAPFPASINGWHLTRVWYERGVIQAHYDTVIRGREAYVIIAVSERAIDSAKFDLAAFVSGQIESKAARLFAQSAA